MKSELVDRLWCPACRADLVLRIERWIADEIETGILKCSGCEASYPIMSAVPRFVEHEDYSGSFGFQWQRFRRTQLDSHSGLSVSRDRFLSQTGWLPTELTGKRLLDVGCGAGRFAEVPLACGADVTAFDYSAAVDVCRENLYPHPRLNVVQADMYRLPFKSDTFDCVYCFGVLQHTPDVERAFVALSQVLKPGGQLAVDVYAKHLLTFLWPKYWLRPLTKRMDRERLYRLVVQMISWLLPVSLRLGRVPLVGRKLRHLIPVANYDGILPLTPEQSREWSVLDTFDMLSPEYDQPQTCRTLRRCFEATRMERIEVFRRGVVVGRGVKALAVD